MKLYMKQKVFSWKDKSYVKNAYGEDVYYVEGEVFSLGKKLHIQDMQGREVAFVRQKPFSLLPRFFVEINGETAAEIVKRLTFLKPKYEIEGPGWTVEGDFLAHDYRILRGGTPVVVIHKQWMTWGDAYELDVSDGENEVLALAVVLAIDAVMDSQAAAASAST